MSENDEEVLIAMLNSDNVEDINLALGIVNNMESNRRLLNKLVPIDGTTFEDNIKWYRSVLLTSPSVYFRKDHKGKGFHFKRGNE